MEFERLLIRIHAPAISLWPPMPPLHYPEAVTGLNTGNTGDGQRTAYNTAVHFRLYVTGLNTGEGQSKVHAVLPLQKQSLTSAE